MQNTRHYLTCYCSIENIVTFFKDKKASYSAVLLASVIPHRATWCENGKSFDEMNIVNVTTDYIDNVCKSFNISERTFKNALKELQECSILLKIKRNTYYVNPFWCSQGNYAVVKEFRQWCIDNNMFMICKEQVDLDPGKQKHACMYTTIDNLKMYATTFTSVNTVKKQNSTELLVYYILSCKCNFIKYPGSAELCNVVLLDGNEQKHMANKLGISQRSLRDALLNLTRAHFLHKLDGTNCKYIINPMIAAKGEINKIAKLQNNIQNIQSDYFEGCASGDVQYINDINGKLVYVLTGEIIA